MILSFMAGSVVAIGFGVYFVTKGLRGIREKEFPLTDTQNVTGRMAAIAGGIMVALGVLAVVSGIAIIAFGFMRIVELTAG